MDRLAQIAKQEQRDARYDALSPEDRTKYGRLTDEETYLVDRIAELDECATMLANHCPNASGLVKQGNDLLRRALCLVADEAHDMLCEDNT